MSKIQYTVGTRKVRIRWGRLLAVGGVLLMLLSFPMLSWLLRSGLDQTLLTRALSDAAGMEVRFDSYSLGWAGQAHLKGLKVVLQGEQLLAAQGLQASFSWWSLLRRQPEVNDLRLESPQLTLSESRLARLRERPGGEGSELALDFENASVSYLGKEAPLRLERLSGRYSEGKVEIAQEGSFEGELSWDQSTHRYILKKVPLKLVADLSGRTLPEGIVDLDFLQKGDVFEGEIALESGLVSGIWKAQFELKEPTVAGVLSSQQWTLANHPVEATRLPFRWDGAALHLKQATVTTRQGGEMALDGVFSSKKANLSLTRDKLALSLEGTAPPFALSASWDGVSLIEGSLTPEPWTLKVGNLNGGYLMRLGGVDGVGFDFAGELVWREGLLGSLTSPGGRLKGFAVGGTEFDLSAEASGKVHLLGSTRVGEQPLSLKVERNGANWHLTASGQKIPASLVQPGRGGTVDLTAHMTYPGEGGQFEFEYSGDKQVPPLNGRGALKKQVVSFQELRLPRLSPPLIAQGTYGLGDGALNFTATLEGQPLRSLWAASPVQGKLHGQASLKGTSDKPIPSFHGELKETRWQGTDFGTVAVKASNSGMKATLADFSLARVQKLKPYLSGIGTVQLEGLPPEISASLEFPSVKFRQQELGQVKGRLHLKGETLVVESLQLPEASLSGTVSAQKMALEGKIKALELSRLPLPSPASGQATGEFSLSGTPSEPRGAFQGKISKLVYGETALGELPVEATFSGDKVKVRAKGIQVEKIPRVAKALPGLKGTLQVGLTLQEKAQVVALLEKGKYGETPLPPVSALLTWSDKVVNLQRLTLEQETPLSLSGTFLPTEGTFQLGSTFDKVELEPVLSLLPQRPPLVGQLSGEMTIKGTRSSAELDFKGSGRSFTVAGVSVGSVPQLNLAATSKGDFMLQADGLAASSIGPLKGLYPGLQGKVSFRASRDPKTAVIGLSGRLFEASIPELNVRANWNGSVLNLESLKAAVSPPLVLSGTVKDGQMNLGGELGGQTLSVLMPLGGSAPPPDIKANLGGNFRLTGPLSNPTASLVGPVTNLVYRTSQLGSGRLQLTVNQRLGGELHLDTPYDATLADAAPGSVTQVPLISDILRSAVKARISGVKIAGTPSNPEVTPVVVGVGVAEQKLQIPNLDQALPEVQQRLPGVLEQTGVKLPNLGNGGARIEIPGTGQAIKIKL